MHSTFCLRHTLQIQYFIFARRLHSAFAAPVSANNRKGWCPVLQLTALLPIPEISLLSGAEELHVLQDNPTAAALLIGLAGGFLLGIFMRSSDSKSAGCSFCKQQGTIVGLCKSSEFNQETRKAKFCPVCGRRLP